MKTIVAKWELSNGNVATLVWNNGTKEESGRFEFYGLSLEDKLNNFSTRIGAIQMIESYYQENNINAKRIA